MNPEVCAVIVTYHPDENFQKAVRLLRPQVGQLVVVDNHSTKEIVIGLRILAREYSFTLIENPDNYGLGIALNQAIHFANKNTECEFILFFDQDSLIEGDFVAQLVAEYKAHLRTEKIFLVMPSLIHRRTGRKLPHLRFHGEYLVAQT